ELTEMAAITEEALAAGAVGVTTSRTILHSSRHGFVPGTNAPPDELLALADAVARAGHGVFEMVSDHQGGEGDRAWFLDFTRSSGAPVAYALAPAAYAPSAYKDGLAAADRDHANGLPIVPQVSCRP